MWQSERSKELEILDKGADHYTLEEYHRCLRLLGRINRFLGGFRASRKAFNQLDASPSSILEVGCGGGYLCQLLQKWLPQARVVGIDINPIAIAHAKEACPEELSETIIFEQQKDLSLPYPENHFSVVTTMLVCHHMSDEELIHFLKESYRISSQAVIINDLQRHALAYASFSLIAPIAFPNRLIWNDGRLSIKRAFRKREWIDLLERAGFDKSQYTLRWHLLFRWTLTLKKRSPKKTS